MKDEGSNYRWSGLATYKILFRDFAKKFSVALWTINSICIVALRFSTISIAFEVKKPTREPKLSFENFPRKSSNYSIALFSKSEQRIFFSRGCSLVGKPNKMPEQKFE